MEPIVASSVSMNEVMLRLGLAKNGGSRSYISKRIKQLNLDTSHFVRTKPSGSPGNKKHPNQILIVDREREHPPHAHMLRRALTESGVPYECVNGHPAVWEGLPLTLQVDHINGDRYDNRKENLRFVCPNCHTQTDNWGFKNKTNHGGYSVSG